MNLPTKITILRLIMIPLLVVSFILQMYVNLLFSIMTALIFAIASVTDFIDGYIARKYNMVTDLGKFLDPIADKILVVAGLLIVMVSGDLSFMKISLMVMTLVIISRELIIGLFRQIAASKNVIMAADNLGKAKTVSTLFAITALLIVPAFKTIDIVQKVIIVWGVGWLIVATILTVLSGVNYIVKNKSVLNFSLQNETKNDSIEKDEEKANEDLANKK